MAQPRAEAAIIRGDNANLTINGPVTVTAEIRNDVQNAVSATNSKDFLEVMKEHLRDMTDIGLASTYKNLKEIDPRIQPSMGIIDLTKGYDGKVSSESRDVRDSRDSRVGIDFGISEMELSQLHDSYLGQNPNRVFLLGDVGSGKTTTSKLYARMVLKGEVTSLKDIELVHFICISDLTNIPTTPFDLLITQQVGLDGKTVLCGEKWLIENASKTLFVLDGLDQCREDLSGKLPRVKGPKAIYSTYVILASIISGDLYPGLKILVTSRWNTFWKLAHRLRSSKTVVLNGFDDNSLKNAARTLAGENEGDKIFAAIENTSMLSVCRTPMFLIYAIAVFKPTLDAHLPLPDTLTSLLSAVIACFKGSENWNDDLETLTKLAYRGTIDNRHRFDQNYLREIGIDSSKLDGILTPRTKLRRYEISPTTGNTTWSFLHQSLQEFLSALGILDLSQSEFDLFVENELNKTELEIVRKFIYGMVFNPATREFCEEYFTGKSVSLEVCKKTLTKQLDKFLATGVIEDISVISLLHECGSGVITQFKSRIDRISTNEEFPKPQDEYSLMSVIRQTVPLTEVQILLLEMSPFFMELIRGIIDKVGNFKIYSAVIGKHMKIEHCHKLTELAPKININFIGMWTTDNIVCTLLQTWIDDKKAPCKRFALQGKYLNHTFRKIGRFLSEIGADYLCFYQCSLTKVKFEVFRDSIEEGAKLSQLSISDDAAMEPDVFEVLPTCLSKGCVKCLRLRECGLTKIKIDSLNVGIDRNKVKLQKLEIRNDDLDRTTIRKLPTVVTKTQLTTLFLTNCSMTEDKFDELADAAKNDGVQLENFGIFDDEKMNADDYRGLGRAIGKARVQTLALGKNKITETKLHEFGDAAEKERAKLQKLQIQNEDLDRTTIRKLPTVVTKTQLTTLFLTNCSMTEDKFDELADAAKNDGVQLENFGISDDEKMNADDYRGLGRAIGKARVQTLVLGNNKITETKLHEFGDAAEKERAKLEQISIWYDPMDAASFHKLAETMKTVRAKAIQFYYCQLTAEKLQSFKESVDQNDVKFNWLHITDNKDLDEECYNEIIEICNKANALCPLLLQRKLRSICNVS